MRTKLEELKNIVSSEVKKLEKLTHETKNTSDDVAATATTSWSAGGDRLHAANQAQAVAENFTRMQTLLSEVENSLSSSPDICQSVSYITLEYADNTTTSFYLVNTPVYINGVKFVSISAPLGEAILGKSTGENVYFNSQVLQIKSVE